MRAVALLVSLSLAACFPNNAKHRTYAKLGEGGALLAGIGMLFFVNTGADCMPIPGMPNSECKSEASLASTIGLGLILTGLVGFIVTVSTSPDDKPGPTIIKAPETPKGEPTPPAPPPPEPMKVPTPEPAAPPAADGATR